ncbi:DNA methyltransferase [Sulfurovum sp.]|uniref:DNA methyltransferase n=1 Tax=Sulfurovum sp. TaxID=1969726 RepID=UPI0035628477
MAVQLINKDCMEYMANCGDKFFDLAIVDPPYGIGIAANPVRQQHEKKQWDNEIPRREYFEQLKRISKNQIIWGGNYFIDHLGATQGFLIWDKVQPHDFSLAMCEFAWMSFQKPAKMFKRSVLKEQNKIHPTQKPVQLYKWILQNYAEQGHKVIDTHLGSGSSAIAAHYFGCDFTGLEIDVDYFEAAKKRLDKETRQMALF